MKPVTSMLLRLGVLAIATLLYAWLITRREFDFFGSEQYGLTYNSMLDHMLQGHWDVDPASIGDEGYMRDGRTYAYFGPFPAFLRLPLLFASDWRVLHVERLSCLFAIMVGIAAQTSAILGALTRSASPIGNRLAFSMVILCAFSGAPMLLGAKGALIYHEAILWAWALAMLFVMLALPAIQERVIASWRRLCLLVLCAGFCLLTRSSTGVGLCLASGLLLLYGFIRDRSAGAWRRLWAPFCILGALVVFTGLVNQGRWGNPFVFANLRMQTIQLAEKPDRLPRLDRHGLFAWERLDLGILYYVFPIWTERLEQAHPISARLDDLFDGLEQPASSLLLTHSTWCFLSALGLAAIMKRRARAGEILLALALAVPPAMMSIAWYFAFRYRIEFEPLLILLSCLGIRDWMPSLNSRALGPAAMVLSALCLVQEIGTTTASRIYTFQPLGPASGYAVLSLRCTLIPTACLEPPHVADAGENVAIGQANSRLVP